jgi:oxygen-dependent protoporphyrinogen oxidase
VLGIPTTVAGIDAYDLLPTSARQALVDRARASSPRSPDRHADDESVADFFRREFGPETVSLVAEPLLGGIHAGDVERLSIGSIAPRLVETAKAHDGAMRGLLDSAQPSSSTGEGLFRSLPNGMSEIVAALESRLPAASIRRRSGASSIEMIEGSWQIASSAGAVSARAVIVSAPAHAAATILARVDEEAARLCAATEYVSTVSVALAWPRSDIGHPLNGSGFVVARRHSDLRITACTWASSKWPNRTPPNMTLLRAFLGSALDPDAASLSDDEILAVAIDDVSRVLQIRTAPALERVHRWTRAGAQHNVGHRARIEAIERRLAQAPGLFAAGSGFRAIGVPDCIADGRAAAVRAADYVKIDR